jgi:uncharacterized membrane protein
MRYSSIDILRTIAIAVMVMVHFSENLSGYTLPFAGLGAPLFAFASGVSYHLWVNGRRAQGSSELEISKVSVRRGLFVFGVGFAFNILVWLPEDTFNWDVLTFIGAALILLNFARRLALSISVLIAIISLFISPLLRALADYPAYWTNGYFECDLTLSDLLIGFTTTGYFPIFPWITYSLTGFVTASLLFPESTEWQDDSNSRELTLPVMLLGTAMISTSIIALQVRTYLPEILSKYMLGGWTMFPPTIEYVLATVGMALLLFGAGHRWIDLNPHARKYENWLNITKTFSRYSFTIYVLHHLVHLWPLWIYGVATGNEPTFYWKNVMPTTFSLPLAFLFLACCYFTLRWLGPNKSRGIESWMRWLCD